MRRHWLQLGYLLCLAGLLVFAGQADAGDASNAVPAAVHFSDPGPVPVPEPSPKALAHFHSMVILLGTLLAWNLLLPVVALFTGFSAAIRAWAQRIGRNACLTYGLYCLAVVAIYYLVSLPLYFYAGFVQPHHYGLSNQTMARWAGDYLKSAGVMLVLALAVGWVPFWLARKSPHRWWLHLGLLMVPFLCFMEFIQPLWIDPLFNQFRPLQNQALEARILAQAARGGIAGSRVYEVDMSADTKAMNAYVTGFLGSKRIVIWDTTLKNLTDEELLFVVGHEMGHYALGHVARLIALETALILASLYLIHWLARRLIARYRSWFGFETPADFAAAPLGFLLGLILMVAMLPIYMAYSRHVEHEADRFGLELTHANHAAATAFVKLQQSALGNPRPGGLFQFWLGSHPTAAERIEFCNEYHPWANGEPSRYAGYIKP